MTHSQLRLAPVSRHSTLQMGLARTVRSLSAKGCGPHFGGTRRQKSSRAAPAVASADQGGQPDIPTFELTTDGALLDAQPSADGELESIVSPLTEVARLRLPDEPGAEDHVCTPADFVVGPVARFEANLAALALVKTLAAEGRPATPDERAVLARFSGFGDSTFEPAFRLSAHRPEDQPWVERGHRLRSLVDDGEWQSLERSRLNAFFTSPDVIGAIWDGLLALGLGDLSAPRILEPAAGVGRFLGLQPTDSADRSVRTVLRTAAVIGPRCI